MSTRRTRSLVLLCCGFFFLGFVCGLFFLGFTSILVPSTHATGYSQSISTNLSPLLTPTLCLTPSPSPSPSPTPAPTIGTTPAFTPTPPILSVAPTSLVFSATPGETSAPQIIQLMNRGGGKLDWTATVVNGVLVSISPSSGSGLGGGATEFIAVAVNTTGLVAGTYSNEVTISAVNPATGQSVAGSPTFVNIVNTILRSRTLLSPTPSLTVSPSPSPSPSPTLCLTPLPTPSPKPSPSPTPETGLGLVQK